ncbi:MAG: hypothetical protein ACRC1P_10945 [Cellulosilyticaceae bacterium]
MSKKLKFSIGGAVKPSKWNMNVISNIKSQLFREENSIQVGNKVKGSFELTTDIQPELRKVGDVTDDFEILESGEVVLNKRTQINDDWTISARETQVDMNGDKENEIHTAVSEDGSDIIIEDGVVGEVQGLSIEGRTVKSGITRIIDDTISSLKHEKYTIPMSNKNILIFKVEDNTNEESVQLQYEIKNLSTGDSGWYNSEVPVGDGIIKIDLHYWSNTDTEVKLIKISSFPKNCKLSLISMINKSDEPFINDFSVPITSLTSTQAVVENNGVKYTFYDPVVRGETKVVDGKLVSLEGGIKGLPSLGSVSGVCDELDLTSGLLINRTFEIMLDSNSNITQNQAGTKEKTLYFTFSPSQLAFKDRVPCCNNFKGNISIYSQDVEGIKIGGGGLVEIRILKSKLTTLDVNGFKAWLQTNPTTVRYQLSEPITQQLMKEQIESYSQHKKQILLSKVGEVADKFEIKEDGSGVWDKEVFEYIMTGNESLSLYNPMETDTVQGFYFIPKVTKLNKPDSAISNQIPNINWGDFVANKIPNTMSTIENSYIYFCIDKTQTPSEYIKSRFDAGNPVVVQYQLANPIATHIPKSIMPTIPTDKINILQEEN